MSGDYSLAFIVQVMYGRLETHSTSLQAAADVLDSHRKTFLAQIQLNELTRENMNALNERLNLVQEMLDSNLKILKVIDERLGQLERRL